MKQLILKNRKQLNLAGTPSRFLQLKSGSIQARIVFEWNSNDAEYEILHEAHYNEYADSTSKGFLVIKSQTEYENELLKRTSETVEAVNFEEETIVLIDMGTRNTGGYTIDIQSFTEENNYIRAKVLLTLPGENCVTTQAITNPFKLIMLKTIKDILVTEELSIASC